MTPDGTRFAFKPVYKIKDGKSLLRLLKQQDLKGLGGVLLEEVQESLPHCEKALKNRANEIVYITRPIDKKKVLFYNDRSANLTVSFNALIKEKILGEDTFFFLPVLYSFWINF